MIIHVTIIARFLTSIKSRRKYVATFSASHQKESLSENNKSRCILPVNFAAGHENACDAATLLC